MFKRLEKAFEKVMAELNKVSAKGQRAVTTCRMLLRKTQLANGRKVVVVKRQRGLTTGTLKALNKLHPGHVSDIVELLPSYGYKVKDESKTKLAVFQTLNRLLKQHKVARVGRGEYQAAV